MDPLDTADTAFGWGIIAAIALTCYFGIPYLVGLAAESIRASLEAQRRQREQAEEELDELARQELLAIVPNEREAEAGKD